MTDCIHGKRINEPCELCPGEVAHRTEDRETYFKRGARVKPAQRRAIIEANMRLDRPPPEAYELAMANLHKPWARRYLRAFRYIP